MTSIKEELTRIELAKADIKDAVVAKGVEVGDAKLDAFAGLIGQIGGGGGLAVESGEITLASANRTLTLNTNIDGDKVVFVMQNNPTTGVNAQVGCIYVSKYLNDVIVRNSISNPDYPFYYSVIETRSSVTYLICSSSNAVEESAGSINLSRRGYNWASGTYKFFIVQLPY